MNIGLYDLKSKLSAVLKQIEASGESVTITRHGIPVAELRPLAAVPKTPKFGFLNSPEFHMAPDFDDDSLGWEDFFASDPSPSARVADSSS